MARADGVNKSRLKTGLLDKSSRRRKRHADETRIVAASAAGRRNDLQPSLTTTRLPLKELKPSPNRARVTTPEQLERLIMAVRTYGMVLPILIDEDRQIIVGHGLAEACKALAMEEVECRIVDHLNPAEREALSLALNRLGETGSYDLELLRERMIELKSGGIELVTTGFTIPEIDQIMLDPAPCEEGQGDDDGALESECASPITQAGDLFQLGDHRLLCGDALDPASFERVLGGRKAQVCFSDPPYNCPIDGFVSGLGQHKHDEFVMASGEMSDAEFHAFLKCYLENCRAQTSQGAIIFACMDWRQIDLLLGAGREAELCRVNVAVWDKGSGGMGSLYRSAHEFIAVFCNGKSAATNNVELGVHGRSRSNVWPYPGANRSGSSSAKALGDHPTPKPIELVEDAILDVSNPGEVVLDPFVGSGTTLVAAERCGRIGCGIELDRRYVDRTIRRWEAYTGKLAVHVETGLTLDELGLTRSEEPAD